MANRLQLQEDLEKLLGANNVYFDPPPNVYINYPCFIYQLDIPFTSQADNKNYLIKKRYSITYIDENPDNDMTNQLLNFFEYISPGNPYVSENLHHYPFDLYY